MTLTTCVKIKLKQLLVYYKILWINLAKISIHFVQYVQSNIKFFCNLNKLISELRSKTWHTNMLNSRYSKLTKNYNMLISCVGWANIRNSACLLKV